MKPTILFLLTVPLAFAEAPKPPDASIPTDAARAQVMQTLATLTAAQSRDASKWKDIEAYFAQIAKDVQEATTAYQSAIAAACPADRQIDLAKWQAEHVLSCAAKPVQSAPAAPPAPLKKEK